MCFHVAAGRDSFVEPFEIMFLIMFLIMYLNFLYYNIVKLYYTLIEANKKFQVCRNSKYTEPEW